ncbi:MAG: dihydroneopterin aldolase [Fidelibacterota bacterium]
MGKIRLNQMLFYGYHGVDELEQNRGGTFEVDLELRTDLETAASTDRLESTVDYAAVYQTVHDCLTGTKYYLLESLAGRIAEAVLDRFAVNSVQVRVRKRNAPVKGVMGSVEVELERTENRG